MYTNSARGNLLDDGTSTYTYDSANRLSAVSGPSSATYAYNGMGDRYQQTIGSQTTTYVLDLNAGLTQVLDDGDNAYLYGNGRIAQVNTNTEYFLGDALGSVRQLTTAQGEITLAKSYQPYGDTLSSVGNGSSEFAYTGEQQDVSGLTYLRARYYASGDGRFLTKDTLSGDYNSPLSLNRWNYTSANPINYTDPSGNERCWVGEFDYSGRADFAEKYVNRTALGYPIRDYLNTYTAAGIGVQCYGTNINSSLHYGGEGIAQITDKQAETEWGKPIYSYDVFGNQQYEREGYHNMLIKIDKDGQPIPIIRGYGLRLPCPDTEELEEPLDQNVYQNAVILMRREIKLVTDVCVSGGCTPTDIYIAAALAQNGPGFNLRNIKDLTGPKALLKNGDVIINWVAYFENENNADDTRDQLILFDGVIQELRKRNWYLPDIKWHVVEELKKIGD